MAINTYKTILSSAQAEFKSKGSSFIAFSYPVSTVVEIKSIINQLKELHHKASHCCYAYRLGTEGTLFRTNDDREPSGSAGRPILGQIDSFELTDILIVVVRYFGGTLLGIPGLINAYKTAALMVLNDSEIIEKNIEKTVLIRCSYQSLNEALRIIKLYNAEIVERNFEIDCLLTVKIPSVAYQTCIDEWMKTRCIEIKTNT